MVWVPGGEFSMGSVDPRATLYGGPDAMRDARPVHRVYVDGFWMDATEVTNEQFEQFVKATGYVTIAERTPTQEEFPTAPPENLVAGSTVFTPTPSPVPLNDHFQWWRYQKGANWRHPNGPDSDLRGREKYPVVHIAYDDAVAYATWARKRLPTEAEFEFAARGGLSGKIYTWGDELYPGDRFMANTLQGLFPVRDTGEDGFAGIAPVKSFPANGYGLYDIAGNVWEWTSDWYRPDYYAQLATERRCGSQPARARHAIRPVGADGEKTCAARRLVPVHRPVLYALHGGNARQRRSQYGQRSPRLSYRTHAGVKPGASSAELNEIREILLRFLLRFTREPISLAYRVWTSRLPSLRSRQRKIPLRTREGFGPELSETLRKTLEGEHN